MIRPNTYFASVCLALAVSLTAAGAAQNVQLQPFTAFGPHGDGSLRTNDVPYLTVGSLQRGMVYNKFTGHLLVISRDDTANAVYSVNILDATYGTNVGKMTVNNLVSDAGNPSFLLNQIGIADDGAIYICNLSSSTQPPQFILYRAANEQSAFDFVNVPSNIDPSNGQYANGNVRWGDTMTVRGSGLGTQILLGTQSGTLAAIYTPTDSSMTSFAPTTLHTDAAAGGFGYGIAFGPGNSFWGKDATATSPLFRFNFDLGAGTANIVQSNSSLLFPARVGPMGFSLESNLLACVESITGPDRVRLYDVSNLSSPPVLLDWQMFPVSGAENGVYAGGVAFGTNSSGGPMVWAMSCNSGIVAYSLVASNHAVPPTFIQQPVAVVASVGSNVTFTVGVDGVPMPTSFQWYFNRTNPIPDATNTTLSIPNAQISTNGLFNIVATLDSLSITSSAARLTVLASAEGLLVYEPFDYTAGQLLTVANPSFWGFNGTGNDSAVVAGNLPITGLAVPMGNSITNGGSGAGLRYTNSVVVIDGSLYFSHAMRIDEVDNVTGAGFLSSFLDQAGASYNARVVPVAVGGGSGQYKLGISKNTSAAASANFGPDTYNEGQLLFIVVRYTFNSGTAYDDTADLWINPDPSTFGSDTPPTPTVSTLVGTGTAFNDLTSIGQFGFRQNSSANTPASVTYDELRIGRTWASVTPPPTVALTVTRSGNEITLSWPVAGSTGYALESINSLVGDADGWQPVENAVQVQGDSYVVKVSAAGRKFFRLKK